MARNNAIDLDVTNNATGFTVGGGTIQRKITLAGAGDITLTQSNALATNYTLPSSLAADVAVVASNYNAAGTVLYGTAASAAGTGSPAVLNAGTAGQVLLSQGTTLAWGSPALLTWVGISAAQAAVEQTGYYVTAGTQTVTLPATCLAGTYIAVFSAAGSVGWVLAQNAGQQVQFGSSATTLGAGGSLASNAIGDGVLLLCTTANTNWLVIGSMGNITVV